MTALIIVDGFVTSKKYGRTHALVGELHAPALGKKPLRLALQYRRWNKSRPFAILGELAFPEIGDPAVAKAYVSETMLGVKQHARAYPVWIKSQIK